MTEIAQGTLVIMAWASLYGLAVYLFWDEIRPKTALNDSGRGMDFLNPAPNQPPAEKPRRRPYLVS
jgi:hypothetical protein